MSNLSQITEDIRTLISAGDLGKTMHMEQLARNFEIESRLIMDRLRQCENYLRKGLRTDALRLAKTKPDLLDSIQLISFPDRDIWDKNLILHRLPVALRPSNESLELIKKAYEFEQPAAIENCPPPPPFPNVINPAGSNIKTLPLIAAQPPGIPPDLKAITIPASVQFSDTDPLKTFQTPPICPPIQKRISEEPEISAVPLSALEAGQSSKYKAKTKTEPDDLPPDSIPIKLKTRKPPDKEDQKWAIKIKSSKNESYIYPVFYLILAIAIICSFIVGYGAGKQANLEQSEKTNSLLTEIAILRADNIEKANKVADITKAFDSQIKQFKKSENSLIAQLKAEKIKTEEVLFKIDKLNDSKINTLKNSDLPTSDPNKIGYYLSDKNEIEYFLKAKATLKIIENSPIIDTTIMTIFSKDKKFTTVIEKYMILRKKMVNSYNAANIANTLKKAADTKQDWIKINVTDLLSDKKMDKIDGSLYTDKTGFQIDGKNNSRYFNEIILKKGKSKAEKLETDVFGNLLLELARSTENGGIIVQDGKISYKMVRFFINQGDLILKSLTDTAQLKQLRDMNKEQFDNLEKFIKAIQSLKEGN